MISSKHIDENDRELLATSLAHDQFHPDVQADVFYEEDTIANLYSDDDGPVLFLRGSRSLRIDMCFVNNAASTRNVAAMVAGFETLVVGAKAAGFKEIVTSSNSPALVQFGIDNFEFERMQTEKNGEVALRRVL